MTYLNIEQVHKSYGNQKVLENISIQVEKGQFVTLLGPSGCGKSTLLRCLAGLEEVEQGKIFLDHVDITDTPAGKRNVGMVFQQYSLFPNLSVEDNIAFGLKMKKMGKNEIKEKVRSAIKLVELEGKETSMPTTLSGGQQQRVALARSIVLEPKVLLLDEPLSAIDAKLRKTLQHKIMEIQKDLNLTVIFVTHDQDEAMLLSDVIWLFNQGKIEQSGTPVQIYTKPETHFAASFIGNYNILDSENFIALTGEKRNSGKKIGIRPETIQIHRDLEQGNPDDYFIPAKIINNSPRGNVLRYQIEAMGMNLHADVLFRSFTLFENGREVFISIPKRDCLELN